MQQHKISVIIPVYNVAPYLDQCLESVLNQSYRALEVILLNDGSVDGSDQICLRWAASDPRIIYISKKNQGLARTRNLGVKAASGEYLVFVDSDDWLHRDYVRALYDGIMESQADICACDCVTCDELTGECKPFINETALANAAAQDQRGQILSETIWSMWTKMYKRELFIENGIEIPDVVCEDFAVYPLLVLTASRVAFIKAPLYYYRINRQESIMNQSGNARRRIEALETCVAMLTGRGLFHQHFDAVKEYMLREAHRMFSEYAKDPETQENQIAARRLAQFLDQYFPGWQAGPSVILFGSFNSRWILQRWLMDRSKLKDHQCFSSVVSLMSGSWDGMGLVDHPNPFRRKQIQRDLAGNVFAFAGYQADQRDYLFIDFLEERFDLLEAAPGCYVTESEALLDIRDRGWRPLRRLESGTQTYIRQWKRFCLKFIKQLKAGWNPDRIVLIRMRLAQQSGLYGKEDDYEDAGRIRRINDMIKECEDYFIRNFPGIHVLDLPEESGLIYTGRYETYGRFPQYLNGKYYRRMSLKLQQEAGRWGFTI